MAHLPSHLAPPPPHAPLARHDEPVPPAAPAMPGRTPLDDDRATPPSARATGTDRPCHLPIAWAARPGLDHPGA